MTGSPLTTLLRVGIATALAAPLLGATPGEAGAAAGDEPLTIDSLPSLTDAAVNEHRQPIDVPAVEAIDVPEIETFEPEVEESGDETVVSLQTDVLFRFGEATLTSSAKDAVAAAVAELPDDAEVEVVGHTDSIGSDADNQTLSTQRARSVAEVIETERDDLSLDVSGRGESDPVEPNERGGEDNPQGREENRRVELRYAN